jgi:hypothetical protein
VKLQAPLAYFAFAAFSTKRIGDLQGRLEHFLRIVRLQAVVGHRWRGHPAAVDDHGRHRFHLVVGNHLVQLAQLDRHAEGVPGVQEGRAVDAVLRHPVDDRVVLVQADALLVHGVEHLGVHVAEAAQRFQRQVEVGFRIVGAGVGHVDAAHLDAVALLPDPFLESRFQAIAHRAVVHEELDHSTFLPAAWTGCGWARVT